jgi:energy-coupling factor transporter ATP-binding protein EcfA2
MPSKRSLIHKIESHASSVEFAVEAAKFWSIQWLEHTEQERHHRITQAEVVHQEELSLAALSYEKAVTELKEEMNQVVRDAGFQASSWKDSSWQSWVPPENRDFPPFLRIGELSAIGQWDCLTFPALISLAGNLNVMFKTTGSEKSDAVKAVQSLLMRLLTAVAPGALRFTFIDPVDLGQNVAPFMRLADYDEEMITGKAWTEPHHIEQRLVDLTEHMENVIQKYLRTQFTTIEEYNSRAGEMAEPYRLLVVMDFPANFSESAARRLVSIAQNGPRCGVYSVILNDTKLRLPYDFNLTDLERVATVIAWNGINFHWLGDDFKDYLLELDSPPDTVFLDRVMGLVGEAAKEAGKVEVPFERITLPREDWWRGNSSSGLAVPLGPTGVNKIQHLNLGSGTDHHVLVAGQVGSGKSTLMHTLIASLAINYSPHELELYLIDFKKGVEFKTYAKYELPHARVIAIESEREFGLSVLQKLDIELKDRGNLFRSVDVEHIASFRRKTGERMPRILLLVDEFQEFFTEDDVFWFSVKWTPGLKKERISQLRSHLFFLPK